MRLAPAKWKILLLSISVSTAAFAEIKKVTLFVNYGQGAILHPGAIESFVNTMTALKNEKGFELTISEATNTAAQKSAALTNLKTMDVVLFANIGENSFQNVADQALIENYFTSGGKGIGFHASIDHHKYWKWWEDLHNGSGFIGHGNAAFKLNADPEMSKLPALKKMWDDNALGEPNISQTEIYTLNLYPRGKTGVTMMQTVAAPNNAVTSHDFTWHRKIGAGEYIFTCLGHGPGDFTGGWMQKATWAWMEYLNGKYNPPTDIQIKLGMNPNSIDFADKTLKVHYTNPYSLKVVNVAGKTLLAKSGQGLLRFNLTGLQTGIYFVKVKGAAGTHSRQILIK